MLSRIETVIDLLSFAVSKAVLTAQTTSDVATRGELYSGCIETSTILLDTIIKNKHIVADKAGTLNAYGCLLETIANGFGKTRLAVEQEIKVMYDLRKTPNTLPQRPNVLSQFDHTTAIMH